MPPLSLLALLSALSLVQSGPSPNHIWIADLKARRATLKNSEVRIEGTVVDVRSTAAEARRGVYRVLDESDSEGVLIRTNRLPVDGGVFRIRGVFATQQPSDGSLLLIEVTRNRMDAPTPVPLIVAIASGVGLLLLGALAIRAARAERRYLVSPPLWLLPEAGPYGKSTAPGVPAETHPALTYDPDLEETDRRNREKLVKRKRVLLRGVVSAFLGLAVSTWWLVAREPSGAPIPAFVLIDANEVVAVAPAPPPPPPPSAVDTLLADRPIEQKFDSVFLPPKRRDTAGPRIQAPKRRDTAVVASRPGTRSDTASTPVIAVPPAAPPAVIPPPPPPPPPAPTPQPGPSPEEELRRATGAMSEGIARLVAAINGKRVTELLVLLPEDMAGDAARLERFIDLVKGFAPRATLGQVDETGLADGRGEARFILSFSWRGDFGVERRKAGRFIGVVRRQDGGWRFEGARLLDAVP